MLKTINGVTVRYTITKAPGGWSYRVETSRWGREGWVSGYKRDAQAVVNATAADLAQKELTGCASWRDPDDCLNDPCCCGQS